jgi:hypothetical protein
VTSTASTQSVYYPSLTAAIAHEHIVELHRAAEASRVLAALPGGRRHRTPRRRPTWWLQVVTRTAAARTA